MCAVLRSHDGGKKRASKLLAIDSSCAKGNQPFTRVVHQAGLDLRVWPRTATAAASNPHTCGWREELAILRIR